MAAKCGASVDDNHDILPTSHWLPRLDKRLYKSRILLILVVYYCCVVSLQLKPCYILL